jgi:NAD(P)-dependent dehydrogenase (short-subunit alcohol dehydrogenase family)
VRVNTLSPGGVRGRQDDEFECYYSDRVPLGRMAKPGNLVGTLLFLVSHADAYVTEQGLRVDGGFTA